MITENPTPEEFVQWLRGFLGAYLVGKSGKDRCIRHVGTHSIEWMLSQVKPIYEDIQPKEGNPAGICFPAPGTSVPKLRTARASRCAAVARRAGIFHLSKGTLWAFLAGGILALGLTWVASRFVRTLIFLCY